MRPIAWRCAVAWLVWLCCGAAFADPPGRVGRLADLRGTVWLYDASQGDWVAAERNRPVTAGDRLSTDNDGRAELRIGSTTVRLGAATQLDVTQLDDERIGLQLLAGSASARLRHDDIAREFELRTPDGRFLPLQAGHYRVDREAGFSAANVWQGVLRFDAHDSTLLVTPGRRAEFWQEGGVTHYTWATPRDDAFTEWARAADGRDDDEADARVSPEMTGAEDLDRYGRWDTHPQYGAVWVPLEVSAGWAPYRDGHWSWIAPWGWTWVDDAPWGFAPFHYGRWARWRGRWCWVPGAYAARPVYAPALVGWVGGPPVGVSVTVGSAPLVGWVPLAPREVYRPWYPVSPGHWRHVNPHVPDQRRHRPHDPEHGPQTYANRDKPGGMNLVPVDVLRQRLPVDRQVRLTDPRRTDDASAWPGGRVRGAPPAPPAMAERSGPPRAAQQPQPRPPAPRPPPPTGARAPGATRSLQPAPPLLAPPAPQRPPAQALPRPSPPVQRVPPRAPPPHVASPPGARAPTPAPTPAVAPMPPRPSPPGDSRRPVPHGPVERHPGSGPRQQVR